MNNFDKIEDYCWAWLAEQSIFISSIKDIHIQLKDRKPYQIRFSTIPITSGYGESYVFDYELLEETLGEVSRISKETRKRKREEEQDFLNKQKQLIDLIKESQDFKDLKKLVNSKSQDVILQIQPIHIWF